MVLCTIDQSSHSNGPDKSSFACALKCRGACACAVLKQVCALFCQDRLSTLVCSFCLWRYGALGIRRKHA